MPLKGPQSYDLDHTGPRQRERRSGDDDSDSSDIDELDPLQTDGKRYTDDASQPLQKVFDSGKSSAYSKAPLAWLDTQRRKGRWQRWVIPSRFCCMLVLLFVVTVVLLLSAGGLWVYETGVPPDGESEPWYPTPQGGTLDAWRKSYDKAAELVGQMTVVEKVNITTGTGWSMDMCVGNTGAVDRLGFPSLCLQDGPLGLRFVDNATAWPAGITVGATWNKDLMYQRGRAHGHEAQMKGVNVLLGPSMGPLGRLPAGGRNWEGFGSDPVLQGIAAHQTIRGIQDSGVMATAKHYVANEQEHFRQSWEWGTPNAISSNIDDRTMHEVYAWPFAESVRAGVASVMCSPKAAYVYRATPKCARCASLHIRCNQGRLPGVCDKCDNAGITVPCKETQTTPVDPAAAAEAAMIRRFIIEEFYRNISGRGTNDSQPRL